MLDLQVVNIRTLAKIRNVEFSTMLRLTDFTGTSSYANVRSVLADGQEVEFLRFGTHSLLISMPGGAETAVKSVTLLRARVESDGSEYLLAETVPIDIISSAVAGTEAVTLDTTLLKIFGTGFDKTTQVRINGVTSNFTIINPATLLCTWPEGARSLDEIEVIVSSTTMTGRSFFSYEFGADMSSVGGTMKLVQQFIKVLLTSPGSDVFNKSLGGGMQKWVGQNVPLSNPQALTTKTVLGVLQASTAFQAAQLGSNLPSDERLSHAQVVGVNLDPSDPSLMELSLKLQTYAGTTGLFNLFLNLGEAISQGGSN